MTAKIFPNENPTRTLSEFEYITESEAQGQRLGKGSFASVRLVREKRTGTLFALKMNNTNISEATKSDLHNLKIEIQIHRELNHPNIVKFHDYFQEGLNVFLILEYAPNGNLYEYINRRKPLHPNQIFRFFYQACKAVQYLHQNDILHRDIKPENLLLDKDLNVKVCDFGWAGRSILERRTTFCGTYEYMAPELVQKKTYDYRVDIWSLGVLLYELLHGHSPYKGRSLSEIAYSLSNHSLTFSSSVPFEVRSLIQKILQFDPNNRPSMEEILSNPWVQRELRTIENESGINNPKAPMYQTNSDLLTNSANNLKFVPKQLQFDPKKLEETRNPNVQRDMVSPHNPHITRSHSQQYLLDAHSYQLGNQASVSEKEIIVTSSRNLDERSFKHSTSLQLKPKSNQGKIKLVSETQRLNNENALGGDKSKMNFVSEHVSASSAKLLSSRFVNSEQFFSMKKDVMKANDVPISLANPKGYSQHKSLEPHKFYETNSPDPFKQVEHNINNFNHVPLSKKPTYITNSNLINSQTGPSPHSMENYSIIREFSKSPDVHRNGLHLKDRSLNIVTPNNYQNPTLYTEILRHDTTKPSSQVFSPWTPASAMATDRYNASQAKKTYLENLRNHYGNLSHSYNNHPNYDAPKSSLLYSNHTPQGIRHQSPMSLKLVERSVSAFSSPLYIQESEQNLNLEELKASVSRLNAKRQDYNKLYHGASGLNKHLSL